MPEACRRSEVKLKLGAFPSQIPGCVSCFSQSELKAKKEFVYSVPTHTVREALELQKVKEWSAQINAQKRKARTLKGQRGFNRKSRVGELSLFNLCNFHCLDFNSCIIEVIS